MSSPADDIKSMKTRFDALGKQLNEAAKVADSDPDGNKKHDAKQLIQQLTKERDALMNEIQKKQGGGTGGRKSRKSRKRVTRKKRSTRRR
jgi:hypothetical protein